MIRILIVMISIGCLWALTLYVLPRFAHNSTPHEMTVSMAKLNVPQPLQSPHFQYASLVLDEIQEAPLKQSLLAHVQQQWSALRNWGASIIMTNAADVLSQFEPAAGQSSLPSSQPPSQEILPSSQPQESVAFSSRWNVDQEELVVEAVLVPRSMVVISSSHDGRIAELPFSHGDRFKKGDVLVRYACPDLDAEAAIMAQEEDLSRFKAKEAEELFKLDVISNLERKDLAVKDAQTGLKRKAVEARLEDCVIRADFNGRVAKRLANAGEYTRTDRVLMEVVSDEALQAEFIVPSKWLRWVNLGAPLTIRIGETDSSYEAFVSRIYGQVDPVSQSIQMVATLEPYQDNLLPGMSGQAVLHLKRIQEAGVKGYLQISRMDE
jgi:membrane fusion protein, multidrug efflux system